MQAGLETTATVQVGDPSALVLALAERQGMDMLVMGREKVLAYQGHNHDLTKKLSIFPESVSAM